MPQRTDLGAKLDAAMDAAGVKVDVKTIRERNRAATDAAAAEMERRIAPALDNVMERLAVFGALPARVQVNDAVRREHAARIAEAVLVLTHSKGQS